MGGVRKSREKEFILRKEYKKYIIAIKISEELDNIIIIVIIIEEYFPI